MARAHSLSCCCRPPSGFLRALITTLDRLYAQILGFGVVAPLSIITTSPATIIITIIIIIYLALATSRLIVSLLHLAGTALSVRVYQQAQCWLLSSSKCISRAVARLEEHKANKRSQLAQSLKQMSLTSSEASEKQLQLNESK